jgi:hypothetical protein
MRSSRHRVGSRRVRIEIVFALMVSASLLAASGCGSSGGSSTISKAEYGQKLQATVHSLSSSLNALGKQPTEFTRIEQNVGQAKTQLESSASQLDGLQVPADAQADNQKLVSGLRVFAADLSKLKSAAVQHDAKKVVAFDKNLDRSPGIQAMMAAVQDLKSMGYPVGAAAASGHG